jgi:hypothetical protein
MMPIRHFYYHRIPRGEVQLFRISKKLFPASFESDFRNIKLFFPWHIHIRKPIKHVHFVAAPCLASAIVIATCRFAPFT